MQKNVLLIFKKTPYDKNTDVRIFCKTDVFIDKLFKELNLSIPIYNGDTDFTKDLNWMNQFDKFYPFRSFPDDSWFDSRDDETALRFLKEQKKGIGIKMVKDEYSGDIKMERYSIDDDDIQKGCGDDDFDLDGFEIYPKKDCPHLKNIPMELLLKYPLDLQRMEEGCEVCSEKEENWLCLTCNRLLCGRMKNQHMRIHSESTKHTHSICISLMDLSFWCYSCDSYITSPSLTPIFNNLHNLKFGENALPIHDIM